MALKMTGSQPEPDVLNCLKEKKNKNRLQENASRLLCFPHHDQA
ncbi:hypothetical protein [Caldithrix abyssi]|uniref:Uncharacterized protein n=1 Tax=Caldithrix abyssi DSM 13497 TaxID=880073 RepID=A0A1J1C5N9_CALAY|nr:hypothetical protein [Caldithrix abyssi]APF17878.1 hypothetical protein Cabys_1129 [Caldithrix abyssi DSM 13497]